mmetsp:Transcript_2834/g.6664  ORF Transcript_2834/g.6664 Transcript_2834/m.6664 type:complete len:589 (+) Transcript_2834:145-1911(+)
MDPDEDPDMDPGKPSKEKKKSRKSSKSESRKSGKKSKKKSSSSQEGEDYSDEGQWDPVKFDKQTGDCWKDIDKPKRAADLPSPDIADYDRQEGDEDWPYKKSYAVDERKSKSKKEKGLSAPRRSKSDDEGEIVGKEKRSSKKEKKPKRKSKSGRSSRSKDRNDDAAEVSDEEEDLHSEEEDEARARRRPKKHSSRRSDSDQSSGEFHDDASDGYDEYSGSGSNQHISDSDEFSEDASYYSDEDGAYSSDLDGSIDSDGTYDSAEEYGEYGQGGMPPETPAMMNYNQEINELMHKANPERTDHLMNRVNRQKGNVTYDQNMPMMTRQALMTRQASAQAQRNRVDANAVDRTKLGFRNESFHGKNNGAAKPVRRGPGGKRAPPRSKSSGLGTMAMASRRAAPDGGGGGGADDPRARFRGRGASTSFQRHSNKPNNVARIGRRGEMDRSGHRPAPSSRGEPRRGNVGRAKSTTALSRGSADPAQKPLRRQPRRTTKEEQLKANEVSDESDSEEYSSDEESDSDGGPKRSRPKRRPKKVVDKQDMTIKKHRRKLHGMMYKIKMSVDMSDLMKEVKKGEIPKDPILALLMDEP